ncbi:MAG: hypothetical protein IH614_11945 [Desulfuromonadales bacterium]|nr:hypothetical protein [Desulfuromonadales bacterium]
MKSMVTLEDSLVIEAAEAEVVELYRSATPVVLLIEGRPGPDAQAVACALRRDGRYLVYVALHLRNTNRALIYAIDQVAGGLPAFAAALQKANDFCGEMGFRMEPVGLRYSAAMREVILRQVPVLFPPQEAQKLALDRAAEIADLEQLVAELGAEETPAGQERIQNADQQIEARQLRNARAAAARAAARKLAGEKRLDEQVQALRRGVEKYLVEINAPEAAATENAERDHLLATLTTAQQRTAQLEGALQSLQEEVQAGRSERQK